MHIGFKILTFFVCLPFYALTREKNIKADFQSLKWNADSITGELIFNDFNCPGNSSIYVYLVNPKNEILEEMIFRTQTTIGRIPFSFQYAGNEPFLGIVATTVSGWEANPLVFTYVTRNNDPGTLHNQHAPNSSIEIIPEGGVLLKNFYSRVAIKQKAALASNENNKLFVINAQGKVVALAPFNQNGIAFAEIPFFEDDILVFQDKNGQVLETIDVSDDVILNDNGFSLKVRNEKDFLEVDMRRGHAEKRDVVHLYVKFEDKILYEAKARFDRDTNWVATHIPLEGLADKLLTFDLLDQENNLLSQRLFYITDPRSKENPLDEICGVAFGDFVLSEALSPEIISDYLIMGTKPMAKIPQNSKAGFQLGFQAKELVDKILNFQMVGAKGDILKIGNVTVGTDGYFFIDELDFSGQAEVTFFIDKKMVFSEIVSVPVGLHSSLQGYLQDTLHALSKNFASSDGSGKVNENALKEEFTSDLANVEVVGKTKSRTEELEEKYIGNIRFKDINAISLDLENDPYTANFDIYDYLIRKIPGLSVRKNPADPRQRHLTYRQGVVDVYLDESFIGMVSDLPFFNLYDIGYIRFNKQAVNSLRTPAGGGAAQGRSMVAGVTASLLIYTKKSGEAKATTGAFKLPVMGYAN